MATHPLHLGRRGPVPCPCMRASDTHIPKHFEGQRLQVLEDQLTVVPRAHRSQPLLLLVPFRKMQYPALDSLITLRSLEIPRQLLLDSQPDRPEGPSPTGLDACCDRQLTSIVASRPGELLRPGGF